MVYLICMLLCELLNSNIDSDNITEISGAEDDKNNGINVDFEYYYDIILLCHFGYSTKQYSSSEELLKDIEGKIPGYSKSYEDI